MKTDWDLWPSVCELGNDDQSVGTQILTAGRLYDIEVVYGPDRPAHCVAVHPLISRKAVCCALWPGHDGPHVACSQSYMDERQFTITGLRTSAYRRLGTRPRES